MECVESCCLNCNARPPNERRQEEEHTAKWCELHLAFGRTEFQVRAGLFVTVFVKGFETPVGLQFAATAGASLESPKQF